MTDAAPGPLSDLQAEIEHLNAMVSNIAKEHQALRRAANALCRSEPGVYHMEAQRDDSAHWPEFNALWKLAKDFEPVKFTEN